MGRDVLPLDAGEDMMNAVENPWTGEERRARRPHSLRSTVYVVDDDLERAARHVRALVDDGVPAIAASIAQLRAESHEDALVVVATLSRSAMTGLVLAARLHQLRPDLPVILLAEEASVDGVVAALRAGVVDFMTLPLEEGALRRSVRSAAHIASLAQDLEHLQERGAGGKDGFIGSSAPMRELKDAIGRISANDVTVQLRGETGTGKELVARAIHAQSERRAGPFVAINCAAVPASLLESELFGYVRGAYTDAKGSRDGFFVQASGGTLFLDEIGDMPLEMQPKLLRALQEHCVRPLGGSAEIKFDTRVISATHHDLDQLAALGRFRQDLYYRLNVVTLDLPPLRTRGNDIIEIAAAVLARAAVRDRRSPLRLSAEVAERLLAYDWPGNVRELENCMERLVALAHSDVVAVGDLPHRIRHHSGDTGAALQEAGEVVSLETLELRYIRHVVKLLGGNKSAAADALGIDRRTLYRRLERHERPHS
jgi:DNA-binding NtrC family response regulator